MTSRSAFSDKLFTIGISDDAIWACKCFCQFSIPYSKDGPVFFSRYNYNPPIWYFSFLAQSFSDHRTQTGNIENFYQNLICTQSCANLCLMLAISYFSDLSRKI